MRIKTYTKKILLLNFRIEKPKYQKSIEATDTFFNILRDILIEDRPYTRIEIRNFEVFVKTYKGKTPS